MTLVARVLAETSAPTTAPLSSGDRAILDHLPHLKSGATAEPKQFEVTGSVAMFAARYRIARADDQCGLYFESEDGTPLLIAGDNQVLLYDAFNLKLVHVPSCSFVTRISVLDKSNFKFSFSFPSAATAKDNGLHADFLDVDLPSLVSGGEAWKLANDQIELMPPTHKWKVIVTLNPKQTDAVSRLDLFSTFDNTLQFSIFGIATGNVPAEDVRFPSMQIFKNLPIEETKLYDLNDEAVFMTWMTRAMMFKMALLHPDQRALFDKSFAPADWQKLGEAEARLSKQLRAVPQENLIRPIAIGGH